MIKQLLVFIVLGLVGGLLYLYSGTLPTAPVVIPDDTIKKVNYVTTDSPQKRNPASASKAPRASTILYQLKANATEQELRDLESVSQNFGLKLSKKLVEGKLHVVHASKHSGLNEDEIAEALTKTGAVEFAEPDSMVLPSLATNDPYLSQQWHHSTIGSQLAWNYTIGVKTITIASCDTGVDPLHPDLKNSLLPAYNSEDRATTNLTPTHPHGTQTAGAMAAIANNLIGVAGVAGGVKILPIKITNFDNGAAYLTAIADCITYAANKGAKVVNLSYGGTESPSIDTAAKYLRSKGGVLIVAAGNDGIDTSANIDYPSMFIVGATDQSDSLTWWTNKGTPTDIVAPGVEILTTDFANAYSLVTGTSLSAPLVSGAAALIYSINANFSPAQVEDILSSTALKSVPNYAAATHGAGRLNAGSAIALAKQLATKKGKSGR